MLNAKIINMEKLIKNLSKKQKVVIGIIAISVITWFYLSTRNKDPKVDFIEAKRGTIIQEVEVTGKVKPFEEANLAFEKTGKISSVYVKIGDKVTPGQSLVVLDSAELYAELAQANANLENSKAQLQQYQAALDAEKAKLAKLKIGSRPEEVAIQEVKVSNAETSLIDAKNNIINKINDAYTKSDDAVRSKIDQFFNNSKTTTPKLSFTTSDSQIASDTEWQRFVVEEALNKWETSLSLINNSSDLNKYKKEADENLAKTKELLDKCSLAVNNLNAGGSLPQTTIDGWKTNIYTGRTNINSAISSLSTAEEKLRAAYSSLTLEKNQLILTKSDATLEDIDTQEAQIRQAEANITSQEAKKRQAEAGVRSSQAQLTKATIKSPINGTVTVQDAKIGEIVSANTQLITIISDGATLGWKIETNIPEIDIAEVSIGDTANVTLDAYSDDVIFATLVTKIDPAETVIEGVPTYKTTLKFISNDERIKSGMTAEVKILTDKKDNVISIPQRAVTSTKDGFIVNILENEKIKEISVTRGIKGSDGTIEILNGINEGDKVITFIKNK